MRTRLFLLSALLLTLAQPPFPCGWLAFVALVPWLFALEGLRPGRAFAHGLLWGLTFNLLGLYWIYNIGPEGIMALPGAMVYLALVWALFTALVARVRSGIRPLLIPFFWTAFVWLLSLGEMGFPWLTLALTQTWSPAAIQTAPLAGSWLIDLWVTAVNALVYLGLRRLLAEGRRPSPRRVAAALAPAAGLVTGVLLYGHLVLALGGAGESRAFTTGTATGTPHWLPEGARPLRVAAVGASVRPKIKLEPHLLEYNLYLYERLTRAAAASAGGGLDLVVWPETAVPEYFHLDLGRYGRVRRRVEGLARELDVPILTGAFNHRREEERGWTYNSAFLVSPLGISAGPDVYDKRILVPFGERVPYQQLLGVIKGWNLGWSDFGMGRSAPLMGGAPLAPGLPRIGPLICYESIFARLVRPEVLAGAQLLAVVTNDAWFGRTSYQGQHLAAAALRAAEFRRPLIRASNGGHSALIDRWGMVHGSTPLYTKHTLLGRLWPETGLTPYARLGDWLPILCLLLALLALILAREPRPPGRVTGGGEGQDPPGDRRDWNRNTVAG
jgi:apolipoprotein N-acyltransferase